MIINTIVILLFSCVTSICFDLIVRMPQFVRRSLLSVALMRETLLTSALMGRFA